MAPSEPPFLPADQPDQLSVSEMLGKFQFRAQPSEIMTLYPTGIPPDADTPHIDVKAQGTDDGCRVPLGKTRVGHAQKKAGGRSGSPRRKSKRRKKRGGWRTTKSMSWREAKDIDQIGHAFRKLGKPLNAFLTVSPEDHMATDVQCKERCYKRSYTVAERLHRRGIPWIGVRVFEKTPGGRLHLHMLIHVPPARLHEVCGWSNHPVLDIRQSGPRHIQYITKQRRSLSPEVEANIRRSRQRGAPFSGRRWSLTKAAEDILNTA